MMCPLVKRNLSPASFVMPCISFLFLAPLFHWSNRSSWGPGGNPLSGNRTNFAVGGQQASGAELLRPLQLRAAFAPPDAALEILTETTALARAQAQELGDGAPGRARGSIAAETMVRIEAIFQSVVELLRHYWARAVHMVVVALPAGRGR